MAALENVLENNLPTFLGVGLVLAIPMAFPSLRPQWAAAIKTGVKLYLEASDEAEGDLIDSLAEDAIDQIVAAIAQPVEARDHKVSQVVSAYKAKARARADRWSRSDEGRRRRYSRHIVKLRDKVSRRQARADGGDAVWAMALEKIA
jgi:hypothetical protein